MTEGRACGLGVRWPAFKRGSPASQLCDLGKFTTSLTCIVFPFVNWKQCWPYPGLLVRFSQDLISRGTWQSLACSQAMASLLLLLPRGCHLKGTRSVEDALEGAALHHHCDPGPWGCTALALPFTCNVSLWASDLFFLSLQVLVCEMELTAAAPTSQGNSEDLVTCVSAIVPSKTTVCSLNCLICFFFPFAN